MWGQIYILGIASFLLFCIGGCNEMPLSTPNEGTTYLQDGCSYCAVHDVRLRVDTVPITYGYTLLEAQWASDIATTTFPNSETHIDGGCTLDHESPRWARVWYCPACRRAEKTYTKSNPDFEKAGRWPPQGARNLPDGPLETAAVALRQNDEDVIAAVLERLINGLATEDVSRNGQAIEAIVRIVGKLDAGWTGYCGPIVAFKDKQPVRSQPEALAEWAIQNLKLRIDLYPLNAAYRNAYDRLRPSSVTTLDD